MPTEKDQKTEKNHEGFVERSTRVLGLIDFRKITTPREIDDVQRLRFEAYTRENNVFSDKGLLRTDKYDNEPNTEIFGLYIDGRIASSVRLHRVTAETPQTPSNLYFPEFFMTRLAMGHRFLEATRFCAASEFTAKYPSLHLLTLRVCFMAALHYDMQFALCSVRAEHSAFYRRYFEFRPVIVGKKVPTISVPANLFVGDIEKSFGKVVQRLPFMNSTEEERRALFDGAFAATRLRVVNG
jgi:N-acyl-L-homoserine lactone synthetase